MLDFHCKHKENSLKSSSTKVFRCFYLHAFTANLH